MYDSFVSDDRTTIIFHKSCVDGLFAALIILDQLKRRGMNYADFNLMPLSPTDIANRVSKVQKIEYKNKIILDLPFFGTNVHFYFDHHITNEKTIPKSRFEGLFDVSAASTCLVLGEYFKITKNQEIEQLIKIANIIDQAQFTSTPPETGSLKLDTFDELVWACNDLIKDIRDDDELIKLIDTFSKKKLVDWLRANEKHIANYRSKRQETLNIKSKIIKSPIIIITNETYHIQAEGLHFALAAEEKEYKMLVLIDKVKKHHLSENNEFKITFRLNPKLNNTWTDNLRVDRIAFKLGGGGHKGASSATLSQLDVQYDQIIKWIHDLSKFFENKDYFSENKL